MALPLRQESLMAATDPTAQTKPGCVASGSKLGKRIALFQALRELECTRLKALDADNYEAARHAEEEIDRVRGAIKRPGPQPAAVPAAAGNSGQAAVHADPTLPDALSATSEGAMDAKAANLLPLSQEVPPSPELPWADFGRGSAVTSGRDSFSPATLPDQALSSFYEPVATFGLGDAGCWRKDFPHCTEGDPIAEITQSTVADAQDRAVSVDKAFPAPPPGLSRGEVRTTADRGSCFSNLSEQPLPEQVEDLCRADGHPCAADSRSTAVLDSMEVQEEGDTSKEESPTQLSEPMRGESPHVSLRGSLLLGASLETAACEQQEQHCSAEVVSARTPLRTEAALVRGFRMHKTPGGTLAKASLRRMSHQLQPMSQAPSKPASPGEACPMQVASPRETAPQQPGVAQAMVAAEAKAFSSAAGAPCASIEEEAAALYPLFGEHLTRCVYSEQCDVRSAALQRLAVDVRSPAAENVLSAESVAGGVAKVLMHTFPDRDVQVFLSSAKLLQAAASVLRIVSLLTRQVQQVHNVQVSAAGPLLKD
eukprot:CAMPEP_0172755884 /NCGR_PEP_ID=MMETSP1074-20121228/160688_1 /TAXON_ID=2916 /ORGANISM="Ceratium fusus, Strain PA161109" /LENGTH=538 /DNA_ID=CAMNT_0013589059 /DNA_START=12 /DNA_END=1629 /DNA_ORIENTATION=+